MKRCCARYSTLALVAFTLLFASAGMAANDQYGEELSAAKSVRIAELLEQPERYLDQRVKVEGLVEDVCPMKGCWIEILEKQSKQTIRFKVEDDVIVFPVEAKGSQVVAEGILRKQEMSKEEAIGWLRHLADEKGETFDETSVTGPMDFYQLEGIGAELSDSE